MVGAAVAFAVTVGGPILVGMAVGAAIGAGVGGVIGGISSAKSEGSFVDGFANGFMCGAISGAVAGTVSGAVSGAGLGLMASSALDGAVDSAIYIGETLYNGGKVTAVGLATSFVVEAGFSAIGGALSKKISKAMEQKAIRNKVLNNIADSKAAREASKFSEYANHEKKLLSLKENKKISTGAGESIKGGGGAKFAYKNNPMENPKVAKDIIENSDAVYGYSPNPESTRIGDYANKIDWTNEDEVEIARQIRQAYHNDNEAIVNGLSGQGFSMEEIAAKLVEERNANRLNSYIKNGDLEGLEIVKKSNLNTYGNESGMTLQQALEKYGSYEEVIKASSKSNPGMDACTGLYDIYYGGE